MTLRSPALLWALLALQGLCTVFFVFDSASDFLSPGSADPFWAQAFEYLMTVTLVASLAGTAMALRAVSARQRHLQQQLDAASGAFEAVLDKQFAEWALTASEADVARLAIKGLSIAEMAQLRGSKEGTIKAQSAAVYRKAGVKGRLQLISLFVEEIMAEPVAPRDASAR